MTPLLCICVPTYNRAGDLAKLLACLDGEIGERGDVIVQISDNASPDGTAALLTDAVTTRPWLKVFRQEENLGAVRNLQWLIEHAPAAEYLWLFGDDDLIVPGALAEIAETLKAERPAWLFLPHHWMDDAQNVVGGSPVPAEAQRFAGAGELFRAYDHWLTFLSASILRADALREAGRAVASDNAYIPLLWYFRAGLEGPCCVAARACVLGGQEISWRAQQHVFLTMHFTALYDDGLHAGVTADEFGVALDGLYRRDYDLLHHWRRIELEQLAALVERFPQSDGLRGYLWTLAFEQGRHDVLGSLEGAVRAMGADEQARALVASGEEAFARGDALQAARHFDAAAQLAPTLAEAWNDLAVALHHLGHADALRAVDSALFVAPDDADAQSNRATILQAA
ncbi:MAG TPA: glycosyltransferase [Solirubrobacteraceae bacterium]